MRYQFSETITDAQHDEFVKNSPLCNLLQSTNWGKVKDNWKYKIVGVYDGEQLVASSMVLIKPLPLSFSMFYIPRGPVMDFENKDLVSFYMKALKKFAKKYHCLFITFDPAVCCNQYTLDNVNETHIDGTDAFLSVLEQNGAIFKGFTKSLDATIQPRYHAYVHQSEDFLSTVTKSCRKALNTVTKKGVEVKAYHCEGLHDFAAVMHCTEKRKGIHLRDEEYFKKIMETYGDDAVIYLAKLNLKDKYEETLARYNKNIKDLEECPENAKKKRFTLEELNASLTREVKELKAFLEEDGDVAVLSGALCVKFGHTSELLYAGMDDRYKRYMAPYASFYNCMTWSFDKGCDCCNMGGIEGSFDGGLTKFKANYNPLIHEFVGEFDLPVYKSLYKLAIFAMNARKKAIKRKA